MQLLSLIILFFILISTAVMGFLAGHIYFSGAMSIYYALLYFIIAITIGVFASMAVSKIRRSVSMWYILSVFPVAGVLSGILSQMLSGENDGKRLLIVAATFFLIFLVGRTLNARNTSAP
jgi:hypothetical protein